MAGLVYTMLRVNSFRESGTTFLDLSGDRATIDALKGYIGARVSTTFSISGVAITPELRGRLLYDFLDDRRGFTARFVTDPAATPVPVTGVQPGRLAGMVGVGVSARIAPNWQAHAGYDAELRHNSVSHLVSGGLRLRW
jgi:outer membrane autotransporter protein